jgi:hypothetical protein
LANIEVPLPSLEKQRWFAERGVSILTQDGANGSIDAANIDRLIAEILKRGWLDSDATETVAAIPLTSEASPDVNRHAKRTPFSG